MLHLAICDKSLNDIEQMEKYLENIKFFNFDYEVFENAKELYKYQTQHHENFDIYILSIELEDMLGLEVARKLREDSQEALIIFVSNDAKCVFDVFEVFTFAFLLKPLTYNKFSTTLYNAFNYLYRTKRLFLFSYRKCNYSILCISDNISMYLRCVLIENATFNPNDKLEKLRYKFRGNRLSELTKQLIFIEPYNNIKKRNKVPAELESWVKEHIYHNDRLNAKVESLREVFENEEQSIIHGDLHTGSFMVNNDQVKVIDPEFACWGPIGFDLGCLLANLIIDYLFHLTNNEEYCLFIIKIIYNILSTFEKDLSEKIPKNYKTIMIDSAAYAGTEIIRRTIGIALAKEVSIMDEKGNNIAFRKNLLIIGIDLITNSEKYGSCENFIKRIKKLHVN